MELNTPPVRDILSQASNQIPNEMPICATLIRASNESLCFTDWLKLMRDKDIKVLSTTFDKRTEAQNVDVTGTAIFFMALDKQTNIVDAPPEKIIETMTDLELCAYCEKMRRAEYVWFPRKQHRGFNKHSVIKLLERVALVILRNIFESTNEDFLELLDVYIKKTVNKNVADAASVWKEK